jgi:hypothetical protein
MGILRFPVSYIKWIMLVSGALTCTMIYAAIAPDAALQSNFGATLSGPAADVVVRNWGVLITLMGAMLIYGAFVPPVRGLVLTVAGFSKFAFIALVLSHGDLFMPYQVGTAVIVDAVWVVIFAWYFMASRAGQAA